MEQELLTLPEHLSSPAFLGKVRDAQFLAFCLCFVYGFILLTLFFWPLYCLSVFNLHLLITHVVSFNFYDVIFTYIISVLYCFVIHDGCGVYGNSVNSFVVVNLYSFCFGKRFSLYITFFNLT